jgi:UDP-2,4-diacetamido-2,4,6-trideoxy-beta-L-altropyranose hydrolase
VSRLLVRADAGLDIGTGHVLRCLALTQAWNDLGGASVYLGCAAEPGLTRRLDAEYAEVLPVAARHPDPRDLELTIQAVRDQRPDWLVVDGYHFDRGYQRGLAALSTRVLWIDDEGLEREYETDLLLNQNLGAEKIGYRSPAPPDRLLGPTYALLRREFAAERPPRGDVPALARRILVTMGGGDAANVTQTVLDALDALDRVSVRLEARVVAGAVNPRVPELRRACASRGFELVENATNMAALMQDSDLAVSAAGSSCWELCCEGVPTIAIPVADNQRAIARGLDEAGAARDAGWHRDLTADLLAGVIEDVVGDPGLRRRMTEAGQALVDGKGAQRVVSRMRGHGRSRTAGD